MEAAQRGAKTRDVREQFIDSPLLSSLTPYSCHPSHDCNAQEWLPLATPMRCGHRQSGMEMVRPPCLCCVMTSGTPQRRVRVHGTCCWRLGRMKATAEEADTHSGAACPTGVATEKSCNFTSLNQLSGIRRCFPDGLAFFARAEHLRPVHNSFRMTGSPAFGCV